MTSAIHSSSNASQSAAPRLKVFLSYSRRNLEFADRLAAALDARGVDVLIDRRDLPLAVEFQAELLSLIRQADAVVTVLSPASVTSTWCAWEIEQATVLGKRLVPALVEAVEDAAITESIRKINYVSFAQGCDFETQADALAHALLTDVGWVKEHTRLAERARLWDEHERSGAFVLRGKELDDAEAWAAQHPARAPSPTDLHRVFIRTSRHGASRRQRIWLGAAIAVAVTATGLALLAEINRREAVAQRDRAERVVVKATGTANALVFELAHRFQGQLGVPQALIIKNLRLSQALMEDLAASGETQPAVLRSQAISLMELSAALRTQGDADSAREAAQGAAAILDRLAASTPGSADLGKERSAAYDRLGDACAALGDRAGALSAFETSLSAIQRLAQASPQRADLQRNLAVGYEKIADLRTDEGRYADALALHKRSLDIRSQLFDKLDRSADSQRDLSVSYEKIGNVLMREDQINEAMVWYGKSLELSKSLAIEHSTRTDFLRDLASSYQRIANALYARGEIAEAIRLYREDLTITTQLTKADESRTDWRRDLAISYQKLGDALQSADKLTDALSAYASSCAILGRLAASGSADDLRLLASCEKHTCNLLVDDGKPDRAFILAEQTVARVRSVERHDEEITALLVDALGNAAWYAVLAKRHRQGLQFADEALARDPGAMGIVLNKAHALMFGGDADAARQLYLAHAEDEITGQGRWSEAVLSDFDALRRSGLAHPVMTQVEVALRR